MEPKIVTKEPGLLSRMSLIWKRIDYPGHEWCSLIRHERGLTLHGVVIVQWKKLPCNIEYVIRCNHDWHTREVLIMGNLGSQRVVIDIKNDIKRRWRYNGELVDSVEGTVDIDLGFSPATNLLPIKRLGLVSGQPQKVTAAWVEFPSLKLKPLQQEYTKINSELIHYESGRGKLKRNLRINRQGFVIDYPDFWHLETAV